MKCLNCGYSTDKSGEWIYDYYFDGEDESPLYRCPKCKNTDETMILDEWGNKVNDNEDMI